MIIFGVWRSTRVLNQLLIIFSKNHEKKIEFETERFEKLPESKVDCFSCDIMIACLKQLEKICVCAKGVGNS